MQHHLRRVIGMIRAWRDWLPGYATAGAWFFAIGSMIPLLWLAVEGHGPGESSKVFATTVDGVSHSVWGLTYAGMPGTALLWMELLAVAAATIVTALPVSLPLISPQSALRLRRIGHGWLTGWASLWMLGTMHLASIDPGFWTLQATFITALFGCTVYRAIRDWTPRNSQTNQRDEAVEVNCVEEEGDASSHPIPYRELNTDVADVSRFMLHRSAVRPSPRITEVAGIAGRPSWVSAPPVTEDDMYGSRIRAGFWRAAAGIRHGAAVAFDHARRIAVKARMSLGRIARSV